jgi:hypothetical protein
MDKDQSLGVNDHPAASGDNLAPPTGFSLNQVSRELPAREPGS